MDAKHIIAVRKSGSFDFNGIVRAALMPLQKQTVLSMFVKKKGAAVVDLVLLVDNCYFFTGVVSIFFISNLCICVCDLTYQC